MISNLLGDYDEQFAKLFLALRPNGVERRMRKCHVEQKRRATTQRRTGYDVCTVLQPEACKMQEQHALYTLYVYVVVRYVVSGVVG